jgi:DNA-directed RNA polymerase specialized sigma24 family protein
VKTGFCSKCNKVWTLETKQGQCQWCGKPATRLTVKAQALRSIKSSRRRKAKQAQDYGNGYSQLEGEWATYYQVASHFTRRVKGQDRLDLLHDIILTLALAINNNGHMPITEASMYRIASHTVANYWRSQYRLTNGLDCGNCSNGQRAKCRKEWLYPQCPKAIRLESLSRPVVDENGNMTELGELIADDKALDLDAWLDTKTFLQGCPQRLIAIAQKKTEGQALSNQEHQYLWRFRQKAQGSLF